MWGFAWKCTPTRSVTSGITASQGQPLHFQSVRNQVMIPLMVAPFSEKIVKNHLWEDMAVLRGRREAFSDKIQYNLFYRKWGFKYFSLNNFCKKKKKNYKITTKNNFWGTWPFLRQIRRQTTEMSWTFSVGNGVPHAVYTFFS